MVTGIHYITYMDKALFTWESILFIYYTKQKVVYPCLFDLQMHSILECTYKNEINQLQKKQISCNS